MSYSTLCDISVDAVSNILIHLPFRCATYLLNTGDNILRTKIFASYVPNVELSDESDFLSFMRLSTHHQCTPYFQNMNVLKITTSGRNVDGRIRTLDQDILPPSLGVLYAPEFVLVLSEPRPSLASINVYFLHTTVRLDNLNELSLLKAKPRVPVYTSPDLSKICSCKTLVVLRIYSLGSILKRRDLSLKWRQLPCLQVLHIKSPLGALMPDQSSLPSLTDLSVSFDNKSVLDLSKFITLNHLCVACKNRDSVEQCLFGRIIFPKNITRLTLTTGVDSSHLSLAPLVLNVLPDCLRELVLPAFTSKSHYRGWIASRKQLTRIIWHNDEWIRTPSGIGFNSLCEQVATQEWNKDFGTCQKLLDQYAPLYETLNQLQVQKAYTALIGNVFAANPTVGAYMTKHVRCPSQLDWVQVGRFQKGKIIAWINTLAMDDEAVETCILSHLLANGRYLSIEDKIDMLRCAELRRPSLLRRLCQLLWLMAYNFSERENSVTWSIFTRHYAKEVIQLLNEHYHDQVASISYLAEDTPFAIWSLQNHVFCTNPRLTAHAIYMMDHPEWTNSACQGTVRSAWFNAYPKWRTVRIIYDSLHAQNVQVKLKHVIASYYDVTVARIMTPSLVHQGCSCITVSNNDIACSSSAAVPQRRWQLSIEEPLKDSVLHVANIVSEILTPI